MTAHVRSRLLEFLRREIDEAKKTISYHQREIERSCVCYRGRIDLINGVSAELRELEEAVTELLLLDLGTKAP